MEIRQKRFSNKTIFEFGDETLKYTVEDKGGAGDLIINYADFPQQSSMKEERNDWLKNVGLLWVALGTFQIGSAIVADSSLSGKGFWLMVGLFCLAIYKIATTKYSVFSAEHGTIYVIRDKKHDEIVSAINDRRKKQLLMWYGDVNPENKLETEIEKFRWLSDQNVISKDEAERKIAQAEILHNDNFALPGERPTH